MKPHTNYISSALVPSAYKNINLYMFLPLTFFGRPNRCAVWWKVVAGVKVLLPIPLARGIFYNMPKRLAHFIRSSTKREQPQWDSVYDGRCERLSPQHSDKNIATTKHNDYSIVARSHRFVFGLLLCVCVCFFLLFRYRAPLFYNTFCLLRFLCGFVGVFLRV